MILQSDLGVNFVLEYSFDPHHYQMYYQSLTLYEQNNLFYSYFLDYPWHFFVVLSCQWPVSSFSLGSLSDLNWWIRMPILPILWNNGSSLGLLRGRALLFPLPSDLIPSHHLDLYLHIGDFLHGFHIKQWSFWRNLKKRIKGEYYLFLFS